VPEEPRNINFVFLDIGLGKNLTGDNRGNGEETSVFFVFSVDSLKAYTQTG
jgi:hypothetical protein